MRLDNTLRARESGGLKVIFVASWSENNREVFGLSLNNHFAYCNRHGYELANIEEPYNKFVDTDRIRRFLRDHDLVVTIGTDVMIQRLDDGIHGWRPLHGIALAPQIGDGVLNADLVIYRNDHDTLEILAELDRIQRGYVHGQAAINAMYTAGKHWICAFPHLQIAAPEMNPGVDYSGVSVAEYFAIHYHTMGAVPVPSDKAAAMRAALSRPEEDEA